jgi:hypothetical protein
MNGGIVHENRDSGRKRKQINLLAMLLLLLQWWEYGIETFCADVTR